MWIKFSVVHYLSASIAIIIIIIIEYDHKINLYFKSICDRKSSQVAHEGNITILCTNIY